MILLIVLLALCFGWGCICTAVAMAKDQLNTGSRGLIARYEVRIAQLEDRLQAGSLSEFRAHNPLNQAMPTPPADADEEWATDATGLILEKLPPLTEAEKAIIAARELGS